MVAGNIISQANTSRNLAVGTDGTIFVLYRNPTEGIVLKRSTDRGATFGAPVVIAPNNIEAEVATSSNGNVYVVWHSTDVLLRRSTDGGATFGAPITVANIGSTSLHMATDGPNLYIIPRNGQNIYVSNDSGDTFDTVALGGSFAFSDVLARKCWHVPMRFTPCPALNRLFENSTG